MENEKKLTKSGREEKLKKGWPVYTANALLVILLTIGIVVYFALPWILDTYIATRGLPLTGDAYRTTLSLLFLVGVPVLALLLLALLLMLNITRNKAFVKQNALYLRLISICALAIGVIFLLWSFVLKSIFTLVMFVVFVLLAIMAKVFADLFKTAARIKKENELTI